LASLRRLLSPLTATVAWVALLVQLPLSIQGGVARGDTVARAVADYFSFYTILTNLLVALVLTVPAVAPRSAAGRVLGHALARWTAAAAILVVGIAYHLLLSDLYNPTGVAAVTDLVFHYLVPALYALTWVCALPLPTRGPLWPALGALSAYPVAYFAYLLARGAVVGSYPYFFVDAGALGVLGAFRNALGLLAVHLLLAWGLRGVAQRVQARLAPAPAAP
ncbi:MAG: Pr6Pr family membrane protein, partial [Gemmatimonadetes bacterium]|nr:Pr6Pr family membrane protein [Gemmatimonadota bacterium]